MEPDLHVKSAVQRGQTTCSWSLILLNFQFEFLRDFEKRYEDALLRLILEKKNISTSASDRESPVNFAGHQTNEAEMAGSLTFPMLHRNYSCATVRDSHTIPLLIPTNREPFPDN